MALTPAELTESLSSGSLLARTGVAIVPDEAMSALPLLGVRWNASVVDIAERWLAALPREARFLDVTPTSLLSRLDAIASETQDHRCVLIANADVLLAKLDEDARANVWSFLFSSLKKRPTALVVVLAASGEFLLPIGMREQWERADRLALAEGLDSRVTLS